jgi:hypothetical protein
MLHRLFFFNSGAVLETFGCIATIFFKCKAEQSMVGVRAHFLDSGDFGRPCRREVGGAN